MPGEGKPTATGDGDQTIDRALTAAGDLVITTVRQALRAAVAECE